MIKFGPYISILLLVFMCDLLIANDNVKTCYRSTVVPSTKGIRVNSLYAFESIALQTLHKCRELCQRRLICKSANFIAGERKCHLNAVMLSDDTAVLDINAEYIEKDAVDTVSI